MKVAMVAVVVMDVIADQIIGVIVVRQRLVTAPLSMLMVLLVIVAGVLVLGFSVQLERVLVSMAVVSAVQMSVMQVVGMVVVTNRRVSAVVLMFVIVTGMGRMFHLRILLVDENGFARFLPSEAR
jgi:hypothetical protein